MTNVKFPSSERSQDNPPPPPASNERPSSLNGVSRPVQPIAKDGNTTGKLALGTLATAAAASILYYASESKPVAPDYSSLKGAGLVAGVLVLGGFLYHRFYFNSSSKPTEKQTQKIGSEKPIKTLPRIRGNLTASSTKETGGKEKDSEFKPDSQNTGKINSKPKTTNDGNKKRKTDEKLLETIFSLPGNNTLIKFKTRPFEPNPDGEHQPLKNETDEKERDSEVKPDPQNTGKITKPEITDDGNNKLEIESFIEIYKEFFTYNQNGKGLLDTYSEITKKNPNETKEEKRTLINAKNRVDEIIKNKKSIEEAAVVKVLRNFTLDKISIIREMYREKANINKQDLAELPLELEGNFNLDTYNKMRQIELKNIEHWIEVFNTYENVFAIFFTEKEEVLKSLKNRPLNLVFILQEMFNALQLDKILQVEFGFSFIDQDFIENRQDVTILPLQLKDLISLETYNKNRKILFNNFQDWTLHFESSSEVYATFFKETIKSNEDAKEFEKNHVEFFIKIYETFFCYETKEANSLKNYVNVIRRSIPVDTSETTIPNTKIIIRTLDRKLLKNVELINLLNSYSKMEICILYEIFEKRKQLEGQNITKFYKDEYIKNELESYKYEKDKTKRNELLKKLRTLIENFLGLIINYQDSAFLPAQLQDGTSLDDYNKARKIFFGNFLDWNEVFKSYSEVFDFESFFAEKIKTEDGINLSNMPKLIEDK
jgi:hypothetical protein